MSKSPKARKYLPSPLRYPGGKSRAVEFLYKNISKIEFDEFREPFVGGGSVFLYTKQNLPTKKYWINDLYFYLYNFWQQAKLNPELLVNEIKNIKNNFLDGRELFKMLKFNIDNFDEVKKATAFFVLNRITFSGTTLSGGYSQKTFDGRFTDSSIDRLESICHLLQEVKITNYDYENLIFADSESNSDKVLIFLDPPYYSATKSALYGNNGNLHKAFNHNRFAEIMKNCPYKWMITYDNSDYIKQLFSFADVVEWDLVYGMRNVGFDSDQLGKELLIANFDLHKTIKKDNLLSKIDKKLINN